MHRIFELLINRSFAKQNNAVAVKDHQCIMRIALKIVVFIYFFEVNPSVLDHH